MEKCGFLGSLHVFKNHGWSCMHGSIHIWTPLLCRRIPNVLHPMIGINASAAYNNVWSQESLSFIVEDAAKVSLSSGLIAAVDLQQLHKSQIGCQRPCTVKTVMNQLFSGMTLMYDPHNVIKIHSSGLMFFNKCTFVCR